MSLAKDLALGLATMRAHQPGQAFQWEGITYRCTYASGSSTTDLGEGGFKPGLGETLFVLKSDLPVNPVSGLTREPVSGDIFTCRGVDLKVETVRTDPEKAAYYRVELISPDI